MQKYYYDRGAKLLSQLDPDEQIRVRQENKWEPATVESKAGTPRSYLVHTGGGQKLRRNRRHLLKTTENRTDEPEIFYDCQEDVPSSDTSNSCEQSSTNDSLHISKKFTSSSREVKISKRFDDYVKK